MALLITDIYFTSNSNTISNNSDLKKAINNLNKHFQRKFRQKSKKIYVYRNLYLELANTKKKVYSLEPESNSQNPTVIINKSKKTLRNENNFPYITKYNDIKDQKISTYWKNNSSAKVYLIEESTNITYISIKSNKDPEDIIQLILSEIS